MEDFPEIPAMGIRRLSDGKKDYYFDFCPDGKAVIHIHGDIYTTAFEVRDCFVSLSNMALAIRKLYLASDGLLYLRDYLAVSMVFSRENREKEPVQVL